MRVPLAANSSYAFLLTCPCILLRGYTLMSALVSTRKEIFVFLSVMKIWRDPRPSLSAAFTDGWSRFLTSKCMGMYTSSRVRDTPRGRNIVHLATASLGSANGSETPVVAVYDICRLSACLFALAFAKAGRSRRWWRRPQGRWLPHFVQAAR